MRNNHKILTKLLLLVFVYLVLSLSLLERFPRTWVDESWGAITGYTLLTEGRLGNPILSGRSGLAKHFLQPRLTENL